MSDCTDSSSIPAVENIGLNEENVNETPFECTICLETARNPVATQCGHLYCWPCLYIWMNCHPNNKVCPTCRSGILTDLILPIYASGAGVVDAVEDTSAGVPPRPPARRIEPPEVNPNVVEENEENGQLEYQPSLPMKIICLIYFCVVNFIFAMILSNPVKLEIGSIFESILNVAIAYVALYCNIFF